MTRYHLHCGRGLDEAGWCHHCKVRMKPGDVEVVAPELAASLRKLRDTMDAREKKRRGMEAKQTWGIRKKDPRVLALL